MNKSMKKFVKGITTQLFLTMIMGGFAMPSYCQTAPHFIEGEKGTIWLLPHSHYDLAWLDPEPVTAKKIAQVVRGHIKTASDFPNYRFVIDQVPEIQALQKQYPAEMELLKGMVQTGQAELVGGLYIQPDENLSEGETLLQTGAYGQRWLQQTFGKKSGSAFDIDSFGHSAQMPQILKLLGIEELAFARKGDKSTPPATEFLFTAPDGQSKVLTHWMSKGYEAGQKVTTIRSIPGIQKAIIDLYGVLAPKAATKNVLVPVGGDYATSSRLLAPAVEDWNANHADIKMNICTLSDYLAAVRAEGGQGLKEYAGEFNREFSGNYSARIWIKQENRRLEHLLLTAEKLGVLASESGYKYPVALFDEAWVNLILNQFHDLLPATAVDGVYGPMEDRYHRVEETASQVIGDAVKVIGSGIKRDDSSLSDLLVANTLDWDRRDIVTADLDRELAQKNFKLVDSRGVEIPYQLIGNDEKVQMTFISEIPSLGYKVYRLIPGVPSADPRERIVKATGGEQQLGRYSVSFDAGWNIKTLKSAQSGLAYINTGSVTGKGKSGNEIVVSSDGSNAYFHDGNSRALYSTFDTESEGVLYSGPVMDRVVAKGELVDADLIRETRFYRGLERVDFITDLDWFGQRSKVTAVFPTVVDGVNTTEIPYGFIERRDGQWPVIKWADKGTDSQGIALLNKGLPDYTIRNGKFELTLLRSIDYTFHNPGDSPDALGFGKHRFEYALLPHGNGWRAAEVPKESWQYNSPLTVTALPRMGDTSAKVADPAAAADGNRGLLQVKGSAIVTGLRYVDDKGTLEVRLQETDGKAGKITVVFNKEVMGRWTNAMGEEVKGSAPFEGDSVAYDTLPQEIRVMRVSMMR